MEIRVNHDTLALTAPGFSPLRLTPGEAFELAEQLVRAGIRVAMLDESEKLERELAENTGEAA